MFSSTSALTAIVLVVALGVMGVGLITAEATPENETNSTEAVDEAINETVEEVTNDSEENDSDGTTVVQESEERIDSDLVIDRWEYDRSREAFTIYFVLESDRPKRVTVTEAVSVEGGGTGQMSIRQERLLPGETALTVDAQPSPSGEAAVAITTSESVDRGQGVYVSTGHVEQNPFRHFGGTTGIFSGVGLSIVMSGLSAWWVLRREESGVVVA